MLSIFAAIYITVVAHALPLEIYINKTLMPSPRSILEEVLLLVRSNLGIQCEGQSEQRCHPQWNRNFTTLWATLSMSQWHGYSPFKQDHLVWCHRPEVLPLLIRVVRNTHRLPLSIRVNEINGECVLRIDTSEVTKCQGPIKGWMGNRPPKIDYLEAAL
jgi:hypothetical protein